ncbi:unnamed protein product, partial [Trichobilharzia szidati]
MERCCSSKNESCIVQETRRKRYYTNSHRKSTYGAYLLSTLPFIIRNRILSLLSIDDLICLSDSCEELRLVVKRYCLSKSCRQLSQFYDPHDHGDDIGDDNSQRIAFYRSVGVLFNIICKDMSFWSTLEMLKSYLTLHLPQSNYLFPREKPRSRVYGRYPSICRMPCFRCPSLYFYGIFLDKLTFTWSKNDTNRVHKTLVHMCFNENFRLRLSRVLRQRPGVDHRSELAIRLFIRKVFLDPVALPFVHEDNHKVFSPAFQNENFSLAGDNSLVVEDEETTNSFRAVAGPSSASVALPPQVPSSSGGLSIRYNWKASGILMKILRPYDIQKQLRLLFILYGPIHR